MNQEIPKPLRNALARQAVGGVHPSPDVLTSFMERTLAPMESEAVTHHLAQCAECREIVFLASNAAEEEVPHVKDLVAAAASGREAATPAYAALLRPGPAQTEAPRSKWTVRTRWVVAVAAAVVLVSGGLVVQSWRATHEYQTTEVVTVYNNRPAPASPEAQQDAIAASSQEAAVQPPVPATLAKAGPPPTTPVRAKKVPEQSSAARNAADQYVSAPAPEPAARATSAQATAGAVGGMNSALVSGVRPQSSLAESEAAQKSESAQPQSLQLKERAPLTFGKAQTGMQSVSTVRPQWRIGPSGHLERSMAADQWTRVLDNQPITFRAVAVIASDVWAGGNGGAFFHSSDGGEHWSKISLAANSNVETGAIVSIRFDDSQHGVVASDSGTRWATADGGVNWTTP